MPNYREISNSAALLGALWYYDPTSEKNDAVLTWINSGHSSEEWPWGKPESTEALKQLSESLNAETLNEIHKSFNRFFVGPYRLPAPPWGSVYTDPESVIFGNQTLAVRQWMRNNLIKMNLKDKEPEDHIGLMLLMLSWALQHGVKDESITQFFEDLLLPWVYRFLELFISAAQDEHPTPPMANVPAPKPSRFYTALGKLTCETLKDWERRFDLHPIEVPLSK